MLGQELLRLWLLNVVWLALGLNDATDHHDGGVLNLGDLLGLVLQGRHRLRLILRLLNKTVEGAGLRFSSLLQHQGLHLHHLLPLSILEGLVRGEGARLVHERGVRREHVLEGA